MSDELNEVLRRLLVLATHKAQRIPTPAEPEDPEASRSADAYCRRFARTQQAEMPTSEVASALIPRLRCAMLCADLVGSTYEQQARLGDASATESALLEYLLVGLWHDSLRARWIAGEIG